MVELLRISKALEDGKGKAGVTIEALLSDFEELTTKNNAPYISGVLRDNKDVLIFKHWGLNMMEFLKKYKLEKGKSYVVQVNGDIEYWEGQMQMNVKNVVINNDRDINNYIHTALYPAEKMISSIENLIDKFITAPLLKKICQCVLKNALAKGLSYYPYNCEVHSEKAGFLYHLYNCITKALKIAGDPKTVIYDKENEPSYKSVVDLQIVITAILCYKLNTFDKYDVDEATGIILNKETIKDALYGDTCNIIKSTIIITSSYNVLIEEGVNDEAMGEYYAEDGMNLLHCITVLNSQVSPATLEAQVVKDIVNSEINEFLLQTKLDSLGEGETSKTKANGKERNFVCLKKA